MAKFVDSVAAVGSAIKQGAVAVSDAAITVAKHAANLIAEYGGNAVLKALIGRTPGPAAQLPPDIGDKMAAAFKQYAPSMKRADIGSLPSDDVVTTFRAGCAQDAAALGITLSAAAEDSSAKDAVTAKIAEVFQPTDATKTMETKLKGTLNRLRERLGEDEAVSPWTLGAGLTSEVNAPLLKAMEAQHKEETARLTALFADPSQQDNLKKAFGVTTQGLNEVRDKMLAALKKDQEDKLKTLNDTLTKKVTELFQLAEAEHLRIVFLAGLAQNKKMLEVFLAHAEETRAQDLAIKGVSSELDVSDGKLTSGSFAGLEIDDKDLLARLNETASGRSLTTADGGNSFEMRLPNRAFSPSFYSDLTKNATLVGDLTIMAAAVKKNHAQIVTEFEGTLSEKESEDLAMAAYTAAIKVGFPPDKIKIAVSGPLSDKCLAAKDEKSTDKRRFVNIEAIFAKRGLAVPTEGDIKKTIDARAAAEKSDKAVADLFKSPAERAKEKLAADAPTMDKLKGELAALRGSGKAAAASSPAVALPSKKPGGPGAPLSAAPSDPHVGVGAAPPPPSGPRKR